MIRDELVRTVLLGLSSFVVGMCLFMDTRHVRSLLQARKRWHVWFVMIYTGVAIIVGLIAELVYGAPGVPLTWRATVYAVGLALILIGMVGVAYSVGRRDKRWTDPPNGKGQ